MDLSNIYQRIIMQKASECPNNNQFDSDVHLTNPTCGDDISMASDEKKPNVEKLQVECDGCIICKGATQMMLEAIQDKSADQINELVLNMSKMMTHEDYDEELLGDLVAFQSVVHLPIRIKCAMLPFKAIYQLINGDDINR
ncbi:SUF system NifU family Fe-S cluster assembly protein [Lactobacillus kunkeei]|uniref:Fe-S cluster assembly sulfur transfer protein SufU n=1 Tax=Apilactobacillus kunkeei TaxID=148814 RepID=UPI0013634F6D|nr:SUF system NifU family Fe-S cluster assembly protein [Apilactobacillus kunkeei]NBI00786.1 SUF system NifU family Fe-S cluster assembly protein [Apilactobacillus kunkeei]